jgi:hypothetical protein
MTENKIIFKASKTFVAIFYTLLITWTIIAVPLLISRSSQINNMLLGMMVFIIIMTWYWSLGIVYRIVLEEGEVVSMRSFRKTTILSIDEFRKIEGPPSRINFGFIKFRVPRETIYSFFDSSDSLKMILTMVKIKNTGTLFLKFSSGYFNKSLL